MSKLTVSAINAVYDSAVEKYKKNREEAIKSDLFQTTLLKHYRQICKERYMDRYRDDAVESSYRWGEANRRTLDELGMDRQSDHHYAGAVAVRNKYPHWVVVAWEEDRIYDPHIQRRWAALN